MGTYDYPAEPHVRRHGPSGYAPGNYEAYRAWLRDEFAFRCVYCLRREHWEKMQGAFEIDHFLPQARNPNLGAEYDNLVYSCARCNRAKGSLIVPDPCVVFIARSVRVNNDGTIIGSGDAQKLIRVLGLDDSDHTYYRARMIATMEHLRATNAGLYVEWMRCPDDLPDISKKRPPGGNSRPEGINQSYFVRRQRGELPETY